MNLSMVTLLRTTFTMYALVSNAYVFDVIVPSLSIFEMQESTILACPCWKADFTHKIRGQEQLGVKHNSANDKEAIFAFICNLILFSVAKL